VVKICAAEACQAMGGRELAAHAAATLGVAIGQSNEDITLEPVYCLGNCACSPAVLVDGRIYGRVGPERLDAIVAAAREAGQ
jgi:formate dehydrogenase subunit gamma